MKILLIDDIRTEDNVGKVSLIARTYEMGLLCLRDLGPWDLVLLDHDLSSFKDGREYTGYDVVRFLEDCPEYLPKDIKLVSANPVGRARMGQVLSKLYGREIK